jgi:hypothetical protein
MYPLVQLLYANNKIEEQENFIVRKYKTPGMPWLEAVDMWAK